MSPKSERFELRLDETVLDRIDRWRGKQEDFPTRSEAVRRLIDFGLESSEGRQAEPLRPNPSDRLMLWMLSKLMETSGLDEYDKKSIKLIQQVIYGGHWWALEWEMPGIFHGHNDQENRVRFVVDTLDMWSFIERAVDGFSDADKDRLEAEIGSWARDPKFIGFDGNNEGEYMSIARFLVDDLDRFSEFKGRDFNSHMHRVPAYGRMLQRFERLRGNLIGRELSVSDLIEIMRRD